MLTKRSDDVTTCQDEAEGCARMAAKASTESERKDFLRLEQNWLKLALSYELAAQMRELLKADQRRVCEIHANSLKH
jgi:hypothetical protein